MMDRLQHLSGDILRGYIGRDLSDLDIGDCECHLAHCDVCRAELSRVIRVMDLNLTCDEAAIIDSAEAPISKRSPLFGIPRRGFALLRWILQPSRLLVSGAMVVAITVGGAALFWNGERRPSQIAPLERTFEGRLSDEMYTPFVQGRAESRGDVSPSAERELKTLIGNELKLGLFYVQHRDFNEAIRHLELAKEQQPASPEIFNDLAVAYMESGREGGVEKALSEFQEVLRLKPRDPSALFNLALAYERLGYFPEAEQQLRLYLQVDSESAWATEVKAKLQTLERQVR